MCSILRDFERENENRMTHGRSILLKEQISAIVFEFERKEEKKRNVLRHQLKGGPSLITVRLNALIY